MMKIKCPSRPREVRVLVNNMETCRIRLANLEQTLRKNKGSAYLQVRNQNLQEEYKIKLACLINELQSLHPIHYQQYLKNQEAHLKYKWRKAWEKTSDYISRKQEIQITQGLREGDSKAEASGQVQGGCV